MEEEILQEMVPILAADAAPEGDIKMSDAWGITAWTLDFCRAARERPKWARLLFRFVIGRYAYREFIGLQDHLKIAGYCPYHDYGLERQKYHGDKMPWDFGTEREPSVNDFPLKRSPKET